MALGTPLHRSRNGSTSFEDNRARTARAKRRPLRRGPRRRGSQDADDLRPDGQPWHSAPTRTGRSEAVRRWVGFEGLADAVRWRWEASNRAMRGSSAGGESQGRTAPLKLAAMRPRLARAACPGRSTPGCIHRSPGLPRLRHSKSADHRAVRPRALDHCRGVPAHRTRLCSSARSLAMTWTPPLPASAAGALPVRLSLYHRTTPGEAHAILRSGFRDAGTWRANQRRTHASRWTGIWLSDCPPDAHDPVCGTAVLLVQLTAEQAAALDEWAWVEVGQSHREWLVPTGFLNAGATAALVSETAPGCAPASHAERGSGSGSGRALSGSFSSTSNGDVDTHGDADAEPGPLQQ